MDMRDRKEEEKRFLHRGTQPAWPGSAATRTSAVNHSVPAARAHMSTGLSPNALARDTAIGSFHNRSLGAHVHPLRVAGSLPGTEATLVTVTQALTEAQAASARPGQGSCASESPMHRPQTHPGGTEEPAWAQAG